VVAADDPYALSAIYAAVSIYIPAYSHQNIAALLGLSAATVTTRCARPPSGYNRR
jgi:hypothetical protein